MAITIDGTNGISADNLTLSGNVSITGTFEASGESKYIEVANAEASYVSLSGDTMTGSLDVTGTVTADGLTVDGTASFSATAPLIDLFETDTTDVNSRIVSNSSSLRLQTVGDGGTGATNRLLIDHTTGDISFYEDTGSTPKFFWDASAESLGIGTTSPDGNMHLFTASAGTVTAAAGGDELVLENSGTVGMTFLCPNDSAANIVFGDPDDNNIGVIQYGHSTDYMAFTTNASERMRIDSSGRVGIGTDDPSTALEIAGAFSGSGGLILTQNNGNGGGGRGPSLDFKISQSEDGSNLVTGGRIATLKDNGSAASGAASMVFYTSTSTPTLTEAMRIDSSGRVVLNTFTIVNDGTLHREYSPGLGSGLHFTNNATMPALHNGTFSSGTENLGTTTYKWNTLFATNGSINTSDLNKKQQINELTLQEMLVAQRISSLFRTYKWNDSVSQKGDNARIHTGVIAQHLQQAFIDEGLDPTKYGMFCSDTSYEVFDENGNIINFYAHLDDIPDGVEAIERTELALRYSEVFAFICAYNDQRFATLEARVTALEGN